MKKIIILLIISGFFFSLFPINAVLGNSYNPLFDGVVGYWGLNSDSGNIAIDSTDNHYNGTLINMENEDWVIGKVGNCLHFDDITETVDLGSIAGFIENFSIEFWVKFDVISSGMTIIKQHSGNKGWKITIGGGNKIYFYVYGVSSNNLAGSVLLPATWYHIVGIYKSDVLEIYVNNIKYFTNIVGNPIPSTNNCTLYGRGKLDEVVIYNKALTGDEVNYRYNDGNGISYHLTHKPNKPICIFPTDKKLNLDINISLKILVIDMDNDILNVSFYLNNIFLERISNVYNNTIVTSSNLSLEYSMMYHWYVVVEDEFFSVESNTFIFTTKSEPEPVIPNIPPEKPVLISPDNNSINLSVFVNLKAHVDDTDDELIFTMFFWESNQLIYSTITPTNFTIETLVLELEFNTLYSWYVVVTDFIDYNISDIYTFTTEIEVVEDEDNHIPPEIEFDYTILFIGICLAIIVFILEFCSNKLKIKRSNLLSVIELAIILIIIFIMIFLKFS